MRAYDILNKKRLGLELATAEIQFLVQGFTAGTIPDYQMAAFAMAVCCRGMSDRETADLTMAMAHSGEVVDLSAIPGVKVDKHSTGGVGDKISLVLVPMVAACGAPVAKMSGRGLGHTGGTLDKLEAIPGFRVEATRDAFLEQVRQVGGAIVGQSGNLVPADKKLYALRDVTATVESIPLIASSIMSKKIAGGADAIVLDVKMGSGAFMHTVDDAFALADAMVRIGQHVGRQTVALVTGMEQPLGLAVGNALEVKEAVDTLRGFGPEDLEELALALGTQMLLLAGVATDAADARQKLTYAIRSGSALAKLKELVTAQNGDASYINQTIKLPRAERIEPVLSPAAGYVQAIEALAVGQAAGLLGAGRDTKESPIDLGAGVVLKKKVGDAVEVGEALAELHLGSLSRPEEARAKLAAAYRIGPEAPAAAPLLHGLVTPAGIQRF